MCIGRLPSRRERGSLVKFWSRMKRSDRNRRRPPAPGTAHLVQPTRGMVAFTEACLLIGVLIGAAIRGRIYLNSPLRPEQPLLWGLYGLAQDVAILSALGALTLFSTRFIWQRRSWGALAIVAIVSCGVHLVWSELVIFFGHAIDSQDLQVGLKPALLLHSVTSRIVYDFAAALLAAWWLIRWAARRSRVRSRTWATASRLAAVALVAGGLNLLAAPFHQIGTARNPVVTIVHLVRNWPPTDEKGHVQLPKPMLPDLSLRHLAPRTAAREFFDDAFPLAHRATPRSPLAPVLAGGTRPNVVFIVMEGVRSNELGCYGGTVPELTPNLDRLAREGTRVERFYSTGTHTPEGESSFWYGLMSSPYEVFMTSRYEVPMTGIPELFRRAGWKSLLWIHNGDQNFYRRDRFYLPRGFQMLDGRNFSSSEPRTNWGFSDRALARRAVAALDSSAPPFAAMVLTVSNHHPFQLPSDAKTQMHGLPPERRGFAPFGKEGLVVGLHTVPMLRTIHYTDEAVGYFFDLARRGDLLRLLHLARG